MYPIDENFIHVCQSIYKPIIYTKINTQASFMFFLHDFMIILGTSISFAL